MKKQRRKIPALHFLLFELVLLQSLPTAVCKVQQLENTAADPADRIAKPHDTGCICYEMCDNVQIDLTEADEG